MHLRVRPCHVAVIDTSRAFGGYANRLCRRGIRLETPVRAALVSAVAFLALFIRTSVAWSCPGCPAGRAAREQVYGDGFATNLAVALAPFIVIGVVSLWADRIGRAR